jgi:hypothetical protein
VRDSGRASIAYLLQFDAGADAVEEPRAAAE